MSITFVMDSVGWSMQRLRLAQTSPWAWLNGEIVMGWAFVRVQGVSSSVLPLRTYAVLY